MEPTGPTGPFGFPLRTTPPCPIDEQEASAQEDVDEAALAGHWFACAEPERPLDESCWLHDCCRACLIAAQASERRGDKRFVYDVSLSAYLAERLERFGPAPRSAVTP